MQGGEIKEVRIEKGNLVSKFSSTPRGRLGRSPGNEVE